MPCCRRLHGAPAIAGRFDSFRVVEAYAATATGARTLPAGLPFGRAHELARQIEARRAAAPMVTCHNDLLAANFIDDGERIWIVDWEYAGMGDPFFDLANFAVNNGLDEEGERAAARGVRLHRHAGADAHALHVRLPRGDVGSRPAGDLGLDFDFVAYADEHFERLGRTASEARFKAALA